MNVDVLYFARVRDAMGCAGETLALAEGATVSALVEALRARPQWTAIAALPLTFAVNEAVAPETTVLRDGDVVAILPPVSGG